jgi:pectate lyase
MAPRERGFVRRAATLAALCPVVAVLGAAVPASAGGQPAASGRGVAAHLLGRQPLPANDGFAAAAGGTTGGSAATSDHVYTVTTRQQLVDAFTAAGDAPKIIFIKGTIDANTDANGQPLTCDDYAAGTGYTLAGYLAAYDPATWGTNTRPSGPMENARVAAEKTQAKQVELKIPSNTTIVGLGRTATIIGGNLFLDGVSNVIIRNLTLRNAFDCFPQWDPTDTSVGNWNSAFDLITIIHNTEHVWIDHNTFTDAPNLDNTQPFFFNRPFQQHDGATDITDGSDFVTVSWNVYADHDKLMLIGSTNSNTFDDADHLHVTIHHNEFTDVGQRASRLRWGQNDIYDNYYIEPGSGAIGYQYTLGVGVNSHIFAQDNYFSFTGGLTPDLIIFNWGGTVMHAVGNLVNGQPTDILSAYNAANPATPIGDDTSWTPVLRTHVDPPQAVPFLVGLGAGAGKAG